MPCQPLLEFGTRDRHWLETKGFTCLWLATPETQSSQHRRSFSKHSLGRRKLELTWHWPLIVETGNWNLARLVKTGPFCVKSHHGHGKSGKWKLGNWKFADRSPIAVPLRPAATSAGSFELVQSTHDRNQCAASRSGRRSIESLPAR